MEQMEDKLGAILNNPQMMQQILSLAQSLGQGQEAQENTGPAPPPVSLPDFDPAMLQKIASLAGQGVIDGNQKALLHALHPYLSHRKMEKLEKAMRVARMARMASGFLGQGGLSILRGR